MELAAFISKFISKRAKVLFLCFNECNWLEQNFTLVISGSTKMWILGACREQNQALALITP